jgi:hypothetical protein
LTCSSALRRPDAAPPECGVPKIISSMSEIELKYMSWFTTFAVLVSVFQIVSIVFGVDLWSDLVNDITKLLTIR